VICRIEFGSFGHILCNIFHGGAWSAFSYVHYIAVFGDFLPLAGYPSLRNVSGSVNDSMEVEEEVFGDFRHDEAGSDAILLTYDANEAGELGAPIAEDLASEYLEMPDSNG